ncbi:uncharacterized mitochondrial protein AtMg00820-like [Cannabis sativa]|uniref:uncharacterized mitochondrial protein AtMg00820-like n=1 Tax=Cannabis sativa TaxID=3483 RepID=UPI0011DFC0DD|nr:uncharacterized mitochondrial protein AtMg00820-like [Cannabis sativa]
MATKYQLSSSLLPTELISTKAALSDPKWYASMNDEYISLKKQNTWTLVPYAPGMQVLTNKRMHKIKLKEDGTTDRFKSKLIAKGFLQTLDIDFEDTFSHVVNPATVRTVLTLAVSYDWEVT